MPASVVPFGDLTFLTRVSNESEVFIKLGRAFTNSLIINSASPSLNPKSTPAETRFFESS